MAGIYFHVADSAWQASGTPIAHYDANNITGLDHNEVISQWDDDSGNNYHLSQSSPTVKPVYQTNVLNGLPGVYAAGAKGMSTGAVFGTLAQPNTIFVVFEDNGWDGGQDILIDGAGVSNRHKVWDDDKWKMNAGADVISSPIVNRDGQPHIMTAVFNGASSSVSLDGSSIIAGNAGTQALTGLSIFHSYTNNGADSFKGWIYEIIVYSSLEDPTSNEAGLSAKWGITLA